MGKHNHCHCDHELKHCKECDMVYCGKCGQEWGGYQKWWVGTTQTYSSAFDAISCTCALTGPCTCGGSGLASDRHNHS